MTSFDVYISPHIFSNRYNGALENKNLKRSTLYAELLVNVFYVFCRIYFVRVCVYTLRIPNAYQLTNTT